MKKKIEGVTISILRFLTLHVQAMLCSPRWLNRTLCTAETSDLQALEVVMTVI